MQNYVANSLDLVLKQTAVVCAGTILGKSVYHLSTRQSISLSLYYLPLTFICQSLSSKILKKNSFENFRLYTLLTSTQLVPLFSHLYFTPFLPSLRSAYLHYLGSYCLSFILICTLSLSLFNQIGQAYTH
jgi:hypothetical protein